MSFRRSVLGTLLACTFAAGSLAVASPAWGAALSSDATPGCRLEADKPSAPRTTITGTGRRDGCSDIVTYFWVRVYKAIPAWPDSEVFVKGRTHVQNTELSATGPCGGRGRYYTHTSTATGVTGDSLESDRAQLC